MGVLIVLMATNFVNTYTMSEVNVVVPLVLLVVPLALLAAGWHRYVAACAELGPSGLGGSGRVAESTSRRHRRHGR
jgi:hypothetical protein